MWKKPGPRFIPICLDQRWLRLESNFLIKGASREVAVAPSNKNQNKLLELSTFMLVKAFSNPVLT